MNAIEATIRRNVPLAPLTTMNVGGAADYFVHAQDEAALAAALAWSSARGAPVTILGGGSNVIVSDRGVRGLVIRVQLLGVQTKPAGEQVALQVGAGEILDDLVARAVGSGWAGIECLSGVPGSVGATPIQNVGAYGQEIGDVITGVTVMDRSNGQVARLNRAACAFGYRSSAFKREMRDRFVVLRVEMALRAGGAASVTYADLAKRIGSDAPSLSAVREAVLELRRQKSMLLSPTDPNRRSAGSFFTNPVVGVDTADEIERVAGGPMPRFAAGEARVKLSAGWLIEHAGFSKGMRVGNVGLSTKHALALINCGGASAAEVVDFARRVRDEVNARFGVVLDAEPVLVGFDAGDGLLRG
jgi:UDP-N-acetylmuramate dehydrogenase